MTISLAFVNNVDPDIKRNLQQLNRFKGKSLSLLVAIATKVYNNRETPEDRQTQRLAKVLIHSRQEPGSLLNLGTTNCPK